MHELLFEGINKLSFLLWGWQLCKLVYYLVITSRTSCDIFFLFCFFLWFQPLCGPSFDYSWIVCIHYSVLSSVTEVCEERRETSTSQTFDVCNNFFLCGSIDAHFLIILHHSYILLWLVYCVQFYSLSADVYPCAVEPWFIEGSSWVEEQNERG